MRKSTKYNISRVNAKFNNRFNPFPVDYVEFEDSIWEQWITRINDGQRKEHEWVLRQIQTLSESDVEWFAEDYWKASELSNFMFGSLVVAVWSRIEDYLYFIEKNSVNSMDRTNSGVSIQSLMKKFNKHIGIDIARMLNFSIANSVRILSNCFKHNNGKYKRGHKSIDLLLKPIENAWGLKNNKRIDFTKIPLADIIVDCGKFCAAVTLEAKGKYIEKYLPWQFTTGT